MQSKKRKSYDLHFRGQEEHTFAIGLCPCKLFWVFFIGCFLGVVLETAWFLLTRFQLVNRTGLIYGPFNLIYGFGAVLMTLSLSWLAKKRDLWIFLGGGLVGGGYEYLCSWVQEALFGTVSWEYSEMPFNLHGRINLLYSMFWGILALVWVKELYPRMSNWIERIPKHVGRPLTLVLAVFMVVNIVMSAATVARWAGRTAQLPAGNSFTQYIDRHYPDDRMCRIYPSMEFVS